MAKRQSSKKHTTRDQETVRLVNEAYLRDDIKELRRLAAVRGLVIPSLRRKVWPLLLGIRGPRDDQPLPCKLRRRGEGGSERAERDAQTIVVDVARSLHGNDGGLGDHNRDALRARLVLLLRAVTDSEHVFYYQGLHEIGGLLLLQVGERAAFEMLSRLVVTHLRDFTRASLDAALEALHMLQPLLTAADRELAAHLQAADLPPFHAISWVITWFAHHVRTGDALARLFDLFLASHPLTPLYLYAAGMLEIRGKLLARQSMEELHTLLVNFDISDTGVTVDELAMRAVALLREHPPERVHRLAQRRQSCAVEARLVDNVWWVPERSRPTGRAMLDPAALLQNPLVFFGLRRPLLASALVGASACALWLFGHQLRDVAL